MVQYNRKQWTTFCVFALTNFSIYTSTSVIAPLYPSLASDKGATASEYGLILGLLQLVMVIATPIYGKYINSVGPKRMYVTGIYLVAIYNVFLSFINHVDGTDAFIGVSFLLQVIAACGVATVPIVTYSVIPREFPDNISGTFACLEIFSGLGLMTGPLLAGFLEEVGGFTMPFIVVGCILITASTVAVFNFPSSPKASKAEEGTNKPSILALVKIPAIVLFMFALLTSSFLFGFLWVVFEPKLKAIDMDITPMKVCIVFAINAAAYSFSAPGIGCWCDRISSPVLLTIAGALTTSSTLVFWGLQALNVIHDTYIISCVSAAALGAGIACGIVSTFSGTFRTALDSGFPDDLTTTGLVSGLWTAFYCMGCFLGPFLGGVLMDTVGNSWAYFVVAICEILVVCASVIYYCSSRRSAPSRPGYTEIIDLENNNNNNGDEHKTLKTKNDKTKVFYGSTILAEYVQV
ncbi:unnamed protein product [Meganyctiphanes norvegica]|uniref:Major facilitator superfamily (MFS) profile domain-containing protein n=1 Tax=Meganyctiphanes norvegica TaxID=48144 RepID=A0AAV2PX13_MEGNR